ncbi:MAG: hypothetical protein ACK52I_23515 [Pseudomonadota bacterium]|jgi:hypothetical protein
MKTPEQIVAAWREGCRHCTGGSYSCLYCLSDAMVALELSIYAKRPAPPPPPPEPFPDDDPFLPGSNSNNRKRGAGGPGGPWGGAALVVLVVAVLAALAALGAA